jgi:Ca2+/H+ antiporter, TMEM165/GDT1 family
VFPIIQDILIPFIAIAIAEFGDKTQISILMLSSKTSQHMQLLLGIMIAFLIVDGIAVLAGAWITTIVPMDLLKLISGIIFIGYGVLMLIKKEKEEAKETNKKNIFLTGFFLIMITEWGDKTQIAVALFSTTYNPYLVLIGAMIALFILSILAIFLGKIIATKINTKLITNIAGVVFIILGILFLL